MSHSSSEGGNDGSGGAEFLQAASDVTNSQAYMLIAELEAREELTATQAESYRNKYAALSEGLVAAHDREKQLSKKLRMVNSEVLSERIMVEKVQYRQNEEAQVLERLENERDKAQKELEDCIERENVARYTVQELEKKHEEFKMELSGMEQENEALVQPELDKLRKELEGTQEAYAKQEAAFENDTKRKDELAERVQELEQEREVLGEEKRLAAAALIKASAEPERIKKQADSVYKAVSNLDSECERLQTRIAACTRELQSQSEKRQEAEDIKKNLTHKLELHRDTIEHRHRDVDAVSKNLAVEKDNFHQLVTVQAELEMKRRAVDEALRHEADAVAQSNKEFDALQRKLRKKRMIADSAREILPQLQIQLTDAEYLLKSHKDENRQCAVEETGLKQEVDIFIARFLRQESVEHDKKEKLDGLVAEVEDAESEIAQWSAEEHKQNKLIAVLSAQREIKAREASKALQNEKDTREQVKMKELVILDLTKKCNETNNRLKEFSALYDVVKNERNKYVNLIQASSQALAEMKEKIKILQNEVEILRNESLAKDKALAKEVAAHAAAQAQRDALRLDTNKCQALYRQKQETVEQQIVEIDKLNSIINSMERDMLRLKGLYESAVDARNYTGVQLIDRNDELCILYEKSNLQEQTLQQGEVEMRAREQDIRMLNLQLAELQRQIEVTRKQMPRMPEYAEQILQLQQELVMECEMTETLCRHLENPTNSDRWRPLEGEDPDSEQLQAKIQVLEERLNEKKEQLLEKELVLEEVTTLSEKLRKHASDGRSDTLRLAKRVNDFQARIKDTTRKMMATVAELSMYQATAMKLQQEKHAREAALEEARWHVEHNEPPSEAAEREYFRMERERLAREEARFRQAEEGADAGAAGGMVPSVVTRTTAEPRPNAYIPDDLGIPKPYGRLAPFKPTEQGAIMRHIRKPQPPEIEI